MAFGEEVPVRPGTRMNTATGDRVQLPGVEHILTGCIVSPGGAGEDLEADRDADWDSVIIHVDDPVTVPLKRTDIVTVRGVDYQISGLPGQWVDPEFEEGFGGTVINAKLAEG